MFSEKFKDISLKEARRLYSEGGDIWKKALEESGITRQDLGFYNLGEEYPLDQDEKNLTFYNGGSTKKCCTVRGLVVYTTDTYCIIMSDRSFNYNTNGYPGIDLTGKWKVPTLHEAELIRGNIAALVNSGNHDVSISNLGYFVLCKDVAADLGEEKFLGTYSGQMYDTCPDKFVPKQIFIKKMFL